MDIEVSFANPAQREFYYATARNQCFSGGFNNGKSFAGCLKAYTLLSTFPNYRQVIARQVRMDLYKTTYQTFFKICPQEFVETDNKQEGITVLKNGSIIYWLPLDKVEESTLRGLETNSILVDQAEETEEKTYDVLDARIGRWDNATIPEHLLSAYPNWPKNAKTGKHLAPSYMMLLCNPDTQFHYIFRKYHNDSLERESNHFFVEGQWDSSLGSYETYEQALKKGTEYVERFVRGQWGVSNAQIHRFHSESKLGFDKELVERLLKKGNLFRSMDHGEASPTCCLWFGVLDGVYICYREYYVPGKLISYHRQAISDLSGAEHYSGNFADPQIFKKTSQKEGGFWTTSDEYLTNDLEGPPIAWQPADNNEFATRNRINERLTPSTNYKHPITGESPAPGLYFIERTADYPQGCFESIKQIQSQRRKLIGYVDGKSVYSDDREESITDHAYDPTRYFVAMHEINRAVSKREPPKRSFAWFKMMRDRGNRMKAGSLVH